MSNVAAFMDMLLFSEKNRFYFPTTEGEIQIEIDNTFTIGVDGLPLYAVEDRTMYFELLEREIKNAWYWSNLSKISFNANKPLDLERIKFLEFLFYNDIKLIFENYCYDYSVGDIRIVNNSVLIDNVHNEIISRNWDGSAYAQNRLLSYGD